MNAQLDWLTASTSAKRRRDRGMAKAAEHADNVIKDWQEKAFTRLKEFIQQRQNAPFLAEDFVSWSRFKLSEPPDGRAFGAVIQRAVKAGAIVKVGYAPANSSNKSPKCLWQRAAQ